MRVMRMTGPVIPRAERARRSLRRDAPTLLVHPTASFIAWASALLVNPSMSTE